MKLGEAKQKVLKQSKNGYAQHVNACADDYSTHEYYVSDWYDYELTVISYENGRLLSENLRA